MADKKILTGVKHIYFTPWNAADTGLDTSAGAKIELTNVIADTVAITQDDNETSSIECETRDEPIIETIKLGKYQVTMDSADINYDLLAKCMGYIKHGNDIVAAPVAYSAKHACIEVEMDNDKFVLPRVLVASKIDASSLKTGVAKGTVTGSGSSCWVSSGTGSSAQSFEAPFFVCGKAVTYTLSKAQPGSGSGAGA